jgi:coproporphyrinogen III oxidase
MRAHPAFTGAPAQSAPTSVRATSFLSPVRTPTSHVAHVPSAQRSRRTAPAAAANPSWTDHKPVSAVPNSLVTGAGAGDAGVMRARFEKMIRAAQDSICRAVEDLEGPDGARFHEDAWVREGGGGGISRVIQNGKVFEKAGVNVSVVYGVMPPEAVKEASARGVTRDAGFKAGEPVPFFAAGISSVMHPHNPMAPTMHFNYRYFETEGGLWWFGGGTDLTPAYLFEEDVQHFHGKLKIVCDRHSPDYYPKFKKWCDDYFLIKHRGERRGLGGIFFDDLNDGDQDDIFAFSSDLANNVVDAYLPLVEKRKDSDFTQEQRDWQQIRRARYVEFNMIYDRGTIFGLKTGGRIESILMSMPLTARWEYDHKPAPGSWEEKTLAAMKEPVEWV